MSKDTIYALSSGSLPCGVAVIRISGPRASMILVQLAGKLPLPRSAHLTWLVDPVSGMAIDRGLAFWFPGDRSFTGEDVVELHCHGGVAVVGRFFEVLEKIDEAIRPAEAGEFTRRAFHNDRLSLDEVEGLADLIHAETELQRRQAIRQSQGLLTDRISSWRSDLLYARVLIEAELDFSDEGDVENSASLVEAETRLRALCATIKDEIGGIAFAERVREGFEVLVIGEPNSGKSSFINSLAQRDVAIVSSVEGTTRDFVEVKLDLDGLPVTFVDTAGLRSEGDEVEMLGIARATSRAETADLVIWLDESGIFDDLQSFSPSGIKNLIRVRSKSDMIVKQGENNDGCLMISSLTGEGIKQLISEVSRHLSLFAPLAGQETLFTRQRHRRSLENALRSISEAVGEVAERAEVAGELLRLADDSLGRVSGRVGVEDVLGAVFSEFCIGK